MNHTSLLNITKGEFEENVELAIASLPEDVSGNRPATQPSLTTATASKPTVSRVGTRISTFHVGEESAEPPVDGTSSFPSIPTYPPTTLGDTGEPGQQNELTPQPLGEDARLLQKTVDAMLRPSKALGRTFSDQLRFLPSGGDGGQQPGQGQNQYGQPHSQHGQQYDPPLHQVGGQTQTPYKPAKRANPPMASPHGGGNGAGPSRGNE